MLLDLEDSRVASLLVLAYLRNSLSTVAKYSFRPDQRLLNTKPIKRVLNCGLKCVRRDLIIFVLPVQTSNRIGLILSKRVGKANVRNRIRRRLRECFRTTVNLMADYGDIVIIVRKSASKKDYDSLCTTFCSALKTLPKQNN